MTRHRREEELDRDIREHLEIEIRENIERGMSPEAARATALRKFGNVARIKEDTRAVWGWMRAEQMLQDFRYALRMLRKNPAFAAVAILTLALGIGMNTAVFSVVNSVLLKPLSYPDEARLVWLADVNERFKMEAVAGPDFLDWKAQAKSFEKMAGYGYSGGTISIGDSAEQAMTAFVSEDFWAVTGAQPALGRIFTAGERGVVILGHNIFERRLGSDPHLVGKAITIDGRSVTVVGVMPRSFRFQLPTPGPSTTDATEIEAFVPSDLTPATQIRGRNMAIVNVVGKLKPGVTIRQAFAELDAIQARIGRENPQGFYNMLKLRVEPLQEKLVGNARRGLLVLLAAVGFVLLIACANIANLLLARASSRQKEIALRAALGAGRLRMVWQFLAEGLVLSLIGGSAGLLVARWAIAVMPRLAPAAVPRLAETTMDARVLAFTFGISLVTALLFGLGPAVSFSRATLHHVLKEGARSLSSGSAGLNLRRLLVGAELGLAVVLLVGAGLLLKSFWRMNARPPGFNPESILVMKVSLSGPNYRAMPQQVSYIEQALGRLEAAPGVQSAGIANSPVIGNVGVEGAPPFPPGQSPRATYNTRSSGYLRAMGMRLLKGRWITDAESTEVVVVNETFARIVFGNGDAVGKRIRIPRQQVPVAAIVGVVADLKVSKLDADPEPEVYMPYRQSPFLRSADIVVRSSGNPQAIASDLRKLVSDIDRTQPVYHVQTLEQALADSIAPRRFNMFLLGVFALAALVLALVGIYGVMSYSVTQRTHEIGVRIALGAQRVEVLRMVVRQGMLVAGAGIMCGAAAAFGLTRLMGSLLYDVTATDPSTFLAVSVALAAAALVACCVPALKASRVDPIVALRYE